MVDREARLNARKNKEKETEKELTEIKHEVEKQITNIKHIFHNKIDALSKETERIKMEKMRRLTQMKIKITNLLVDNQFKGNIGNCKQDKEENQEAYCNARFPTNWFENKFCRHKENFCGVCCEKEFSVRFNEEREKCLYECRLANGQIKIEEPATPKSETVAVEILNNP